MAAFTCPICTQPKDICPSCAKSVEVIAAALLDADATTRAMVRAMAASGKVSHYTPAALRWVDAYLAGERERPRPGQEVWDG
jgi:hypothetical protein